MFPTRHAIERFQERIAPVTTAEAARRIRAAATTAKARSTPRWWTPVAPEPGLRFLYPADLPGVCLLVRDGAVITIFERSQCRTWDGAAVETGGRRSQRAQPYRRPAPGSDLGDAA